MILSIDEYFSAQSKSTSIEQISHCSLCTQRLRLRKPNQADFVSPGSDRKSEQHARALATHKYVFHALFHSNGKGHHPNRQHACHWRTMRTRTERRTTPHNKHIRSHRTQRPNMGFDPNAFHASFSTVTRPVTNLAHTCMVPCILAARLDSPLLKRLARRCFRTCFFACTQQFPDAAVSRAGRAPPPPPLVINMRLPCP